MPLVSVPGNSNQAFVLTPGMILQDRYRIVRQLGKGGMGAVYEAVDQRLDATVALKETFSADARLRRQFEQEARLLARLHHPALPRVSDYFTEGDRAFLVMQFISGVDLAEMIAKQPGPFPRNQVVAWADQLLDALIYLHTRDRQIIHRDIKPHNLKLTSTGAIALLDFGLAKAQSADQSVTNSFFGYTRRYAPLEQIQDQGTSPQSDIYALGATLYHLLTGVKPVDALARAAALLNSKPDPLTPASDIHSAVGPDLTAILSRAMAQNPEERYKSASEFREALARVGRNEARIAESATRVGTFGTRAVDPFDSYSILKPTEPDWFLPAETRGPTVIAGMILLLVMGGVAAFYGYSTWIESVTSRLNSTPTAAGQRTNDPSAVRPSRSDRPRNNATNTAGPPSFSPDHGNRKGQAKEPSQLGEQPAFRTAAADTNSPVIPPFVPRAARGVAGRQLAFPSPRLPNAELKEIGPALSIQRLPAFGQPEQFLERQILRAPDGTQVVKFSDGTTRVFRSGEKIVPSGITPK